MDLRAQSSRIDKSKRVDGNFPVFEMHLQLEPFGEQRLHHQPHLILADILCRSSRLKSIVVGRNPFRYMGKPIPCLLGRQLVSEFNVVLKRDTRREETAGRTISAPCVQGNIPKVTILAWPHRYDVER